MDSVDPYDVRINNIEIKLLASNNTAKNGLKEMWVRKHNADPIRVNPLTTTRLQIDVCINILILNFENVRTPKPLVSIASWITWASCVKDSAWLGTKAANHHPPICQSRRKFYENFNYKDFCSEKVFFI